MKILFALAAFVCLTGCVTDAASSYAPATPSGKPEVVIHAPVAQVKSALISRAMNRGFSITRDTDYLLQLEKPSDNIAAQVLLGSRYDSTPSERYVFTFAPAGDEVRVVAATMFVTNPGSAFERLTPITTGAGVQQTQMALEEIKTQLETARPAQKDTHKRAGK
jgi:hypothetical protein